MKSLIMFFASMLLLLPQQTFAKKGEKCPIKDPLPDTVFSRMIVNDITYAIVGEQTPISGIKVDVSKPEAIISGVFRPKKDRFWSLLGFEFKGGITDRNFSFLKGNGEFNTAFEFRPSLHFIPTWNSGKYGVCGVAQPKAALVNARNDLAEAQRASVKDSFEVVALIKHHHMDPLQDWESHTYLTDATITPAQKMVLIYFTETLQGNPGFGLTPANTVAQILDNTPTLKAADGNPDMKKYNDKIFQAYDKYKRTEEEADEQLVSKMITNASHIWTRKDYWWLTVTPFAKAEKVNQYHTKFKGMDSLYFKSDYQFYYGLSGYLNYYVVFPKKTAHLLRLGLTGSYSNNLATLSSFNYETRTPFFSQGQSATEKTKSGTAYNYDELKNAWLGQVNFEYYLLPLNTLVPGFYLSSNLNLSDLYKLQKISGRGEDITQFSLESGLVFNVNSREKDKEKSILSILFYVRHEDLTDRRRTIISTGLEESRDEFRKRNMSLGIRVGIPINLPQRS